MSLLQFSVISVDDVASCVYILLDKSSAFDPLLTYIFKQVVDLLAQFVAELFNRSLAAGHFSGTFKDASITPVLKKPELDSADTSSYHPISNLTLLSKLRERLMAHQLHHYLATANLFPAVQSGFWPCFCTETAVLSVISDILLAVDRGDFAALVLLDLSAAFDTVDHDILLQRLRTSFGIDGVALKWFQSYLTGRTQHDRRDSDRSATVQLICGFPQGSVLGPILFILYTTDLVSVFEQHGLSPHLYAEDSHIYGSCLPSVDTVVDWMSSNRLQLNGDKTEFMWLTTARRQQRLPTCGQLIGSTVITPCKTARDLGVYIDADITMRTHLQRTISCCFATLCQLRTIRRSVPSPVLFVVADMSNRRRLRSASSNQLDVPFFCLPTVRSHAFPIAAATIWNSLPNDVTSASFLSTFQHRLKTYLFRCRYNTDWYCLYLLWL